jgi:HTH-type transcriptional regulator/antitoxin HigA
MITNNRQYNISRKQFTKLQNALANFDLASRIKQIGSHKLVQAELNALKSEINVLRHQINEYEVLQSGAKVRFTASDLKELPLLLIRARIAKKLSQRDLANLIGVKEQQIQRYEAEKYATANLIRLKEIADALTLNITEIAEFGEERLEESVSKSKSEELEWQKFPVLEMYKRGWFENFTGSLNDAIQDSETLVKEFITNQFRQPIVALHRKRVRSNSIINEYSLLAWECRVLSLADKVKSEIKFNHESIERNHLIKLAKLSRFPDGPLKIRDRLREAGIILIIEPHLPNTYLDGAAISHKDIPVIGMTLRYDRLDNFWFVLFHELVHISRHLRKTKIECIFDDLEASDKGTIEVEADSIAQDLLIPRDVWNASMARFVRSKSSIERLGKQLEISPAIIAGQIRYEANNYILLNDMIGSGEVRKLFPEAGFGI